MLGSEMRLKRVSFSTLKNFFEKFKDLKIILKMGEKLQFKSKFHLKKNTRQKNFILSQEYMLNLTCVIYENKLNCLLPNKKSY